MSKTTLLDGLYAGITSSLAEVEAEMRAVLASERPAIRDMVEHVGRYAGKRLRPALVLLTARCSSGRDESSSDLVRLAAVVEMVHLATLVHDDVIDAASLRRRSATVNVRWTNYDAVLLGDILFARAINLLARLGDGRALLGLTSAVSTLCEGEVLQNRSRRDVETSEDLYYEIIGAKTAILYATGCELAAHLSGADESVVDAFRTYGHELGVAFQIVDDCLDLTGHEEEVGKSLGTDLGQGKMTLPLILLRERLEGAERAQLEAIVSGKAEAADVAELQHLLRREACSDQALARAAEHAERGVAAVRAVLDEERLAPLEAVASFVLKRSV